MVDQHAATAVPEYTKKEKVVPPSPPKVIRDREGRASFERIGFLGEVSGVLFPPVICTLRYMGEGRIRGERKIVGRCILGHWKGIEKIWIRVLNKPESSEDELHVADTRRAGLLGSTRLSIGMVSGKRSKWSASRASGRRRIRPK
jgi:hypothetical protein